MQSTLRCLLSLAVFFLLSAAPLSANSGKDQGNQDSKGSKGDKDGKDDNGSHGDKGDHGSKGSKGHKECGSDPGDAMEIAEVRAKIAQECDCATATSHDAYEKCVKDVTKDAVKNNELREECRDDIKECAEKSTCGRPNAVTCCRIDKKGKQKCSIKSEAANCKAPKGGTACVATGSCCDTCGTGACVPGSTTTTTTPASTTTTTTTPGGPVCGDTNVDPGEQCDPPGKFSCPDPSSPSGALLECQPGCVCPGGATTTTTTPVTTTTTTTTPGGPVCGDNNVDPGEQCDPPGSFSCPDPSSPSGAMLECQAGCVCPGGATTTTTAPVTTTTTTTPVTTTTTTTTPGGPVCGDNNVDPGEQCDPPGSFSCPDPSSPSGAMLECQAGCVCPGGATTTTTTPTSTTTTTTSGGGSTTTTTGSTSSTTTTTTGATSSTTTSTGPPTTTTTSTPVSTTTTTTGPSFTQLSFTTAVGTSFCGGAGLGTVANAPFSGELDSNTACSSKLSTCGSGSAPCDLGLGCLYFGGGNAQAVPPGKIPDAAQSLLTITGPGTLGPSAGSSEKNCTLGAGPGTSCINGSAGTGGGACTTDSQCTGGGNIPGSCALEANCFFGPPLPIVNPVPASLTTCVINVVQTDASGTFNGTTGDSSVGLPLSSRIFITGNTASPCPKCISGVCDATWKTGTGTLGADSGQPCTPTGASLTSTDCRPNLVGFQAPLAVDLTPLTSGTASRTAANGIFCPNQTAAGAFGQGTAQCIQESGDPAGNLSDGQPHVASLGSVFCIPPTNNAAVDGVADLPGPGAIGLNGVAQLLP